MSVTHIETIQGLPILASRASCDINGNSIDAALDELSSTKQNNIGISSSASSSLFLNEKGEWVSGPVGPSGPIGACGPLGFCGPKGYCGPKGACGPLGLCGPRGACGPQGYCGPRGICGPVGSRGDTGQTGDTGLANTAKGQTGDQGLKGDTGLANTAKGPAGDQGLKGDTGLANTAKGPAGDQGLKGDTGLANTTKGPAGDQGLKGDTGLANTTKGPAGDQGPKGATGPANTAKGQTGATGLCGPRGPGGARAVGTLALTAPTGASGYVRSSLISLNSGDIIVLYWLLNSNGSQSNVKVSLLNSSYSTLSGASYSILAKPTNSHSGCLVYRASSAISVCFEGRTTSGDLTTNSGYMLTYIILQ